MSVCQGKNWQTIPIKIWINSSDFSSYWFFVIILANSSLLSFQNRRSWHWELCQEWDIPDDAEHLKFVFCFAYYSETMEIELVRQYQAGLDQDLKLMWLWNVEFNAQIMQEGMMVIVFTVFISWVLLTHYTSKSCICNRLKVYVAIRDKFQSSGWNLMLKINNKWHWINSFKHWIKP